MVRVVIPFGGGALSVIPRCVCGGCRDAWTYPLVALRSRACCVCVFFVRALCAWWFFLLVWLPRSLAASTPWFLASASQQITCGMYGRRCACFAVLVPRLVTTDALLLYFFRPLGSLPRNILVLWRPSSSCGIHTFSRFYLLVLGVCLYCLWLFGHTQVLSSYGTHLARCFGLTQGLTFAFSRPELPLFVMCACYVADLAKQRRKKYGEASEVRKNVFFF